MLRLAALLAALQCVAHSYLFISYVPSHGPEEAGVVTSRQNHYFPFGGESRSYWGFYYGYGLMSAFSVLLEVVLLWGSWQSWLDPVELGFGR